jgi:hypothetical protein
MVILALAVAGSMAMLFYTNWRARKGVISLWFGRIEQRYESQRDARAFKLVVRWSRIVWGLLTAFFCYTAVVAKWPALMNKYAYLGLFFAAGLSPLVVIFLPRPKK